MRNDMPSHESSSGRSHSNTVWIITVIVCVIILCAAVGTAFALRHHALSAQVSPSQTGASSSAPAQPSASPSTVDPSPTASSSSTGEDNEARARELVEQMSMDDRAAQLIMAPFAYGDDPESMRSLLADEHVGSVILMGNWDSGVAGVSESVQTLQSFADDAQGGVNTVLFASDQEGGAVQHLQGPGFETMPSAVQQGQMTLPVLAQQAQQWGTQLHEARVQVDLAPSVDTVTIDRNANDPIGAWDRDFGLDAAGNAAHAVAFIQGMRQANIGSAVKHYPGLGSVTGNTDFTDEGIVDTTTTRDSAEVQAFTTAIQEGKPAMVMMSLATYSQIDPNTPAAFSSTIVTDMLRNDTGYTGVVISDSLSASAVSGYEPSELGVKLIEAGGDLACINASDYTMPILTGIRERAAQDDAFAQRVTESAVRVMTLKLNLGLY